MVGDKIF